jgi:ATP-dependent Lon protease
LRTKKRKIDLKISAYKKHIPQMSEHGKKYSCGSSAQKKADAKRAEAKRAEAKKVLKMEDSDSETVWSDEEEGDDEDSEDSSDDEEDDEDEDDEDDEDEEDSYDEKGRDKKELDEMIQLHKLHKFVSKLYTEKGDKKVKKVAKSKKHNKSKHYSVDSDDDDSDDDEYEKEEKKFKIVFNIGGDEDDYNSEYESSVQSKERETEEEDSELDEQTFMKEKYVPLKFKPATKTKTNVSLEKRNKGSTPVSKKHAKKVDVEEEKEPEQTLEEEYAELSEIKKELCEKLEKKPTNKSYLKMLKNVKVDIKKLVEKGRKTNTKEFYKLIHHEHKRKNELEYFEKKLSQHEQQHIVSELKTINDSLYEDKPVRLNVLQSKMPEKVKAIALQRLNVLKSMEPGDPEYFKLKNWVDSFVQIPFGKHKNLPVSIADGVDACHEFMENAHTILNECTYGMNDAKMQVMQLVGQWITNPEAVGNAIALKGPPGTGKTSIIKDGISKILGRDFIFIPLGGCTDGSYLEGNSYVYEGSSYGKIIQSIIQCKSMNPVIYFDELDKISDSARGQEIVGILTHLTDTTQNSQFHDKYFSEIDFDLSKCLFMFSYNDETLINPILKDRMYKIMTNGYEMKEKVIIGKKYLIPKILQQIKFTPEDVVIPDATLSYIIENFTKKEQGVRNLKRCLEMIYTKLNLFRLMKPNTTNFFSKEINLSIAFPHTVSVRDVDIFIKNETEQFSAMNMMYV